jgi:hypothetical protein
MTNGLDNHLMLDPSFLFPESLTDTVASIWERNQAIRALREPGFQLFVPERFWRLFQTANLYERAIVASFYLRDARGSFAERLRTSDLRSPDLEDVLDVSRNALLNQVEQETIRLYEPGPDAYRDHEPFRYYLSQAVLDDDSLSDDVRGAHGWVENILFQEWIFLQEMSLVGSRTRVSFEKMIRAGGTCLELGKRIAQKAVRRTRNLNTEDQIKSFDVLMTSFKWIALGGVAVAPQLFGVPPLYASLATLGVNRAFVLIDP